jgi:hypothetical protein
MRHVLAGFAICLCFGSAMAQAAKYELIVGGHAFTGASGAPSRYEKFGAYIFEHEAGKVFYCSTTYDTVIRVVSGTCAQKTEVKGLTGSQIKTSLAPASGSQAGDYNGFWQIDEAVGTVRFCYMPVGSNIPCLSLALP